MNYLAHAVCTDGPDDVVFGAVMSDLFRRAKTQKVLPLSKDVEDGRTIHRLQDDSFNSMSGFDPVRKQFYSMIGPLNDPVLDVVCDHILARNWTRLFDEELDLFIRQIYDIIEPRILLLAPERQQSAQLMIKYDVLTSYRTEVGLRAALSRLAGRSKYGHKITNALPNIIDYLPKIEQTFLDVLPNMYRESQTALVELGYQIEGSPRLHWKEGILSQEGFRRLNREKK